MSQDRTRAMWIAGIDVGGTFTDFLVTGPQGRTAVHKELSTPADPSLAVMTGLAALAAGMAIPLGWRSRSRSAARLGSRKSPRRSH